MNQPPTPLQGRSGEAGVTFASIAHDHQLATAKVRLLDALQDCARRVTTHSLSPPQMQQAHQRALLKTMDDVAATLTLLRAVVMDEQPNDAMVEAVRVNIDSAAAEDAIEDALYDTQPGNFTSEQLNKALWVYAKLSHVYELSDSDNGGPDHVDWDDIDAVAEEADRVLGLERVAVLQADAQCANGFAADDDADDDADPAPAGPNG